MNADVREKHRLARQRWLANGGQVSRDTKEKIRQKLMGHKVSEETKAKTRTTKLANPYKHTEEWKASQSKRLKGNKNGFQKGGIPWSKGLTKEVDPRLENLSGWKGKQFSVIHKQKLKAARARQIIPFEDTQPEKVVQTVLHLLKVPFKTHVPIFLNSGSYHKVDILLASLPCIVEVEGCYFHQCELCGFDGGRNGKSASEIRARDKEVYDEIRGKGFVLHRIWEHETYDLVALKKRLLELLNTTVITLAAN
jgi:G:T-mismatch repair DNA endonuclease (very short patch repair protein)